MAGALIQRSQLIDIVIPVGTTSNTVNIPDQPMLRDGKRITRMQWFQQSDFPVSPISGNPLPNSAQFNGAFFTGYVHDPEKESDTGEFFYRRPLTAMHFMSNTQVSYQLFPDDLDELVFEWEKCQLYFPLALTVDDKFSFVCEVFYTSRPTRMNTFKRKISGLGDGTFIDLLIGKIMALEEQVKRLMSGKK
jgi:hypothetical protein